MMAKNDHINELESSKTQLEQEIQREFVHEDNISTTKNALNHICEQIASLLMSSAQKFHLEPTDLDKLTIECRIDKNSGHVRLKMVDKKSFKATNIAEYTIGIAYKPDDA